MDAPLKNSHSFLFFFNAILKWFVLVESLGDLQSSPTLVYLSLLEGSSSWLSVRSLTLPLSLYVVTSVSFLSFTLPSHSLPCTVIASLQSFCYLVSLYRASRSLTTVLSFQLLPLNALTQSICSPSRTCETWILAPCQCR